MGDTSIALYVPGWALHVGLILLSNCGRLGLTVTDLKAEGCLAVAAGLGLSSADGSLLLSSSTYYTSLGHRRHSAESLV